MVLKSVLKLVWTTVLTIMKIYTCINFNTWEMRSGIALICADMPYVAGMPQSRALMGGPCKNHGFNGGTLHVHVYHVTKFVFTYASRKRDQQLIKSTRQIWKRHNFSKPVNLFYHCQITRCETFFTSKPEIFAAKRKISSSIF